MNIFVSFPCPQRSARYLDDQRVVKMILESCQMLSTVTHIIGHWQPGFPKPTHVLHPCLLWVAEARENWEWLVEHAHALDGERLRRMGSTKPHKTLTLMTKRNVTALARFLPAGSTPHVNCARNRDLGLDFTNVPNVHLAYRKYLRARWLLQKRRPICSISYEHR